MNKEATEKIVKELYEKMPEYRLHLRELLMEKSRRESDKRYYDKICEIIKNILAKNSDTIIEPKITGIEETEDKIIVDVSCGLENKNQKIEIIFKEK